MQRTTGTLSWFEAFRTTTVYMINNSNIRPSLSTGSTKQPRLHTKHNWTERSKNHTIISTSPQRAELLSPSCLFCKIMQSSTGAILNLLLTTLTTSHNSKVCYIYRSDICKWDHNHMLEFSPKIRMKFCCKIGKKSV